MVWFLKKPKTTEPEMGGKISRIEIYSVHDPTLPKYLKELKKDLESFPQEKRDEYTERITKMAKERGFEFP